MAQRIAIGVAAVAVIATVAIALVSLDGNKTPPQVGEIATPTPRGERHSKDDRTAAILRSARRVENGELNAMRRLRRKLARPNSTGCEKVMLSDGTGRVLCIATAH